MSKRLASALVVALAAITGCANRNTDTTADASMRAVNKTCCCGQPTDGRTTRTYNNQTLGFCSPQCADYFSKAPAADQAKMAAKATGTAR